MRCWLAFALLVLALSTGCDTATPAVDSEPEIIPLAVGNQWVMHVEGRRDDRSYTFTDTLAVTRDTTIGGETWYYIQHTEPRLNVLRDAYYANRADGLYRLTSAPGEPFAANLLYKYPAEVGTQYTVPPGTTLEVAELGVPYTAPYGTAPSVYYRESILSMILLNQTYPLAQPVVHDLYLAPGLGPMRLVCSWVRLPSGNAGELQFIGEEVWELAAVHLH